MAKKQKRSIPSNRPATTAGPAVSERPISPAPTTYTAPRSTTFATTRSSYSQEFNPDYTLVIKDLKRIGIMAGTFITLLVILSIFLR